MTGIVEIGRSTPLSGTVTPPGAKSGTVRALLAGTLAGGTTVIRNAGSGDNVRAMAAGCTALGARITDQGDRVWTVEGTGGALPDRVTLQAGNSGIVLRLLAAVGAASGRCVVATPYASSLGLRGNTELIDALRQLGAEASGAGTDHRPPLVVWGAGRSRTGIVRMSGRRSSQPVSGVLFLAPLIGRDLDVVVTDGLSAPAMVASTVSTLARSGVAVGTTPDSLRYHVAAGSSYRPATHVVAADGSSVAGILAAAAAVPGSRVTVTGVDLHDHAARVTCEALERLGVRLDRRDGAVVVHGADDVTAIDVDASEFMDGVLPLAALAAYAEGTTTFRNVEPLRYKECDRISDFRAEMLLAGADVEETRDSLIVHGRREIAGGVQVRGRHDHAVVMALATLALRSREPLRIAGWEHVAQTYRDYFDDLASLGARVDHLTPDAGRAAAGLVARAGGGPAGGSGTAAGGPTVQRMADLVQEWLSLCAGAGDDVLDARPAGDVRSVEENTVHLGDRLERATGEVEHLVAGGPAAERRDSDARDRERASRPRSWTAAADLLTTSLARLTELVLLLDAEEPAGTDRHPHVTRHRAGPPADRRAVADLLAVEAAHLEGHLVRLRAVAASVPPRDPAVPPVP